VDLNRVRLAGRREDAGGGTRVAGAGDERTLLLGRFSAMVELVRAGASGAADSLLLLRVAALGVAPEAAAGLAAASQAVRSGRDPAPALAAVRLVLAGRPRAAALAPWGVVP
ncbi:MAG TPA: hypothetical protein VD793_07325, partial [Gemmatimonadales bacterium]|nr:hypothetical protein [Gemmatimonadales bacterium]